MDSHFVINKISESHKKMISTFLTDHWGSPLVVSRGNIRDASGLPGFICTNDREISGLITFNIEADECEIVTLNSEKRGQGLGTQLVKKVIEFAKTKACRRVWLITTNDNTEAIRFYQKYGFEWIGFHRNAIGDARKLKPEIPKTGRDCIPIKHEIEFEFPLHQDQNPLFQQTPDI